MPRNFIPSTSYLFRDLEFPRINKLSAGVGKVVDVHAAIEIGEGNCCFFADVSGFAHFFAQKVEDRDRHAFLVILLKIKGDVSRCSRVGVNL